MLGLLILVVFIAGIVVTVRQRWKEKDYSIISTKDITDNASLAFGAIIGFLLAILVGIAMNSSELSATYWINGITFKGGTNWLFVIGYFLFGSIISWIIIRFVSALPVMFLYSISKEYRQEMDALRESGNLPVFKKKKFIIILLAVFSGGIANWFYIKIWQIGCLQLLMFIVGSVLNSFGFPIYGIVIFFLTFASWVTGILISLRTKEIKLKNCIINIL